MEKRSWWEDDQLDDALHVSQAQARSTMVSHRSVVFTVAGSAYAVFPGAPLGGRAHTVMLVVVSKSFEGN